MTTTAFVCAMPIERRALVRALRLRKATRGGVPVREGRLAGHDVIAVATGMGTELAARETERLLDAVAVDRVVVVGITGAVDDATPLGLLVCPEVVVDSATGTEHRPAPLGDVAPQGTMWTTDAITGAAEAAELRARGVVSLDMETAAIAACCERRAIPWSVFRAVSDRATDGSVDEEVFRLSRQDGTPDGRAVARYLLRHPGRIPRLAAMGRSAKRATEIAAAAAIDAVRLAADGPG